MVTPDGTTKVFDTSFENLKTLLPKYSNVSMTFSPYIYFVNKKFGLNFKLVSLNITERSKVLPPRGHSMFGKFTAITSELNEYQEKLESNEPEFDEDYAEVESASAEFVEDNKVVDSENDSDEVVDSDEEVETVDA